VHALPYINKTNAFRWIRADEISRKRKLASFPEAQKQTCSKAGKPVQERWDKVLN